MRLSPLDRKSQDHGMGLRGSQAVHTGGYVPKGWAIGTHLHVKFELRVSTPQGEHAGSARGQRTRAVHFGRCCWMRLRLTTGVERCHIFVRRTFCVAKSNPSCAAGTYCCHSEKKSSRRPSSNFRSCEFWWEGRRVKVGDMSTSWGEGVVACHREVQVQRAARRTTVVHGPL